MGSPPFKRLPFFSHRKETSCKNESTDQSKIQLESFISHNNLIILVHDPLFMPYFSSFLLLHQQYMQVISLNWTLHDAARFG
jgi:hypothetical protein